MIRKLKEVHFDVYRSLTPLHLSLSQSSSACVRMDAKIAGQIVGPHPSKNPNLCRVIQLIDGDLKGWIPKALVALVTTKAMPFSLRRVNKMMRDMPKKQKSDLIEEAENGQIM